MIDDSKDLAATAVYSFHTSEFDDPVTHAAQPLHDWENSAAGAWVSQHSTVPPWWTKSLSTQYGWRFTVWAKFLSRDHTFFQLKWAGR